MDALLEAAARVAAELLHLGADKLAAHREELARYRAQFVKDKTTIEGPLAPPKE